MFLLVAVFANFQVCFSNSNSFFRLENDNSVINDTIKPILNESANSELECYMKCLNNRDKCCLLKMREDIGKTSCVLYEIKFHEAVLQRSAYQNKIVSVVGCAPKDCQTWYKSGYTKNGVYDIEVDGIRAKVFCDMRTDGGGWTVVQKRIDGSVNFNRKWDEYKKCFGDPNGEYWLGNEFLHQMTKGSADTLMRIEGMDFQGIRRFITMKGFLIADEANKYQLTVGVFDSGDKGLVFNWQWHNGAYFTTRDNDNDSGSGNCAVTYSSGMWYKKCFGINPNGKYLEKDNVPVYATAIIWKDWTGFTKSLKAIKIQIK